MSISQLPVSAFEKSVLIVAHPDDEILWFGSIVHDVDQIIICFLDDPTSPELGTARKRSLSDLPYGEKTTCLGLPETGTFNQASWPHPEVTEFGVKITSTPEANRIYERRAGELRESLHTLIDNTSNVFTHNPWGEYGHAEHVMVHRVVTSLAEQTGAAIWHSNYASRWSQPLMEEYLPTSHAKYYQNNVDAVTMLEWSQIYKRHGAWTWMNGYYWFPQECFVQGPLMPVEKTNGGWLCPMNFIQIQGLQDPKLPTKQRQLNRFGKKLVRGIKRLRVSNTDGG